MAENDSKSRGRSKGSGKNKGHNLQSPYSKPVSKTRSVSNSKHSNSTKNLTLLTCSSKNLFQDLYPITFEKKHSVKNSFSEIRGELSLEELQSRLMRELKQARNSDEEFEIYQKCFSELIKFDKRQGKILNRIKLAYESRILSGDSGIVSKLRTEIKDLQAQASKDYKDKQLYTKKIEKLAKENVELSRSLDDAEEKYNLVLQRLQEITNYDLQKVPKDEITWKALAAENQSLVKINKDLQQDLKKISSKEKTLINLLLELKRLGYPVEEIYEQKSNKVQRQASPGSYVEDTDNEALVSGRAKSVAKPTCIPALKLKDIQNDEIYSESSDF